MTQYFQKDCKLKNKCCRKEEVLFPFLKNIYSLKEIPLQSHWEGDMHFIQKYLIINYTTVNCTTGWQPHQLEMRWMLKVTVKDRQLKLNSVVREFFFWGGDLSFSNTDPPPHTLKTDKSMHPSNNSSLCHTYIFLLLRT